MFVVESSKLEIGIDQGVEDCRPDAALPAAGQGQFRSHRDLRENFLWEA